MVDLVDFRFGLQMWKGAKVKKTRKLTHAEIKKQLIESMLLNEMVESDDLNKQAEEVQDVDQDVEEAAKVIQKYKNIIRTKEKGIIKMAFLKKCKKTP